MRILTLIMFSLLAWAASTAVAQDSQPAPITFSIPEKMINDQLKGQVFEGDGALETNLGEIPYTWKMTDVTCAFKDGLTEIKGMVEVTAKGTTTKEAFTGTIKTKLFVRKQMIRVTPENILIPISVTVLGSKKKLGEVDLAAEVGPQEVEVAELLKEAPTALLPKDKEILLTNLTIVTGSAKIELTLKDKPQPVAPPKTAQ
jgi:hypothetical protein